MEVHYVEFLAPELPVPDALCGLAGTDPQPNASLRARRQWAGDSVAGRCAPAHVLSSRNWGATPFAGHGKRGFWESPEILLPSARPRHRRPEQADRTLGGNAVLLLARGDGEADRRRFRTSITHARLPGCPGRALGSDEPPTRCATFGRQGVTVKIISGLQPATVGRSARRVGTRIPGAGSTGGGCRPSPADWPMRSEARRSSAVSIPTEAAMVAALQSRGHVVSITGDWVNDSSP